MRRRRIDRVLEQIELHTKMLEAFLIVKEPGARISAEAFEGLRAKIDGVQRLRQRHLAQLATLDASCLTLAMQPGEDEGDDRIAHLSAQIREFLEMENVHVLEDYEAEYAGAFRTVGNSTGSPRVQVPAYVLVTEQGVQVVKEGVVEFGDEDRPVEPETPTDDAASNPEEVNS